MPARQVGWSSSWFLLVNQKTKAPRYCGKAAPFPLDRRRLCQPDPTTLSVMELPRSSTARPFVAGLRICPFVVLTEIQPHPFFFRRDPQSDQSVDTFQNTQRDTGREDAHDDHRKGLHREEMHAAGQEAVRSRRIH